MDFEIPNNPNEDADDYIIAKTREHNDQIVPNDYAPLSVYCRDDDGSIVGGLTGKTYWNYLDIEFLWVEESLRKQGLGEKIVNLAEKEAIRRGCKYSMLDTYEFQALGFYQKQGYEQFGQLDGFCDKYERYYLRKKL
jgi:GNAT superfamily N-acetyltransferase